MAPGGHGLFGVSAILAACVEGRRPGGGITNVETREDGNDDALVAVFSNGEDLCAFPGALIVGYILKEKLGIVMVTTDKTSLDLKGGQLALARDQRPDGSMYDYVTIVEQAQAKESGQLELFERLGLDIGERPAVFNTNMAIFNYQVLIPKLRPLLQEMGLSRLLQIIAPDLIRNYKLQKDKDGVERQYLQLEGAMGSVLLNLDKYWRYRYGEPLVYFINIEANQRTNFFSPIKSAFDFFMQFYSDRFTYDYKHKKLINHRPGALPIVHLQDTFYREVRNVLRCFQGTKILNLNSLHVEGVVNFSGVELSGDVKVINRSGRTVTLGLSLLKNRELIIDK
ncbi:MAG: UTP--glucose-1-phosphate uridylyltransferase [Oligoflexia bacterium]|nr:UTP--glucose-1-phosphate uridylyltransferase [Oligoflexia bacterium]